MKIIDVDALHIRIEDPNIGLFDGSYDDCLIVVRTDEGLTGIGEVESLPAAIQGIVRSRAAHNHARGLRELLIGQDPTDPERLWQLMYDATDYVGRRGLMMHAIGGIDLALWDIAGQAAGKPISELLGGRRRERIEAYGTIYPMARDEEAVRAQVAAARGMGLRNFKFSADPWWMDDLDATARLLQAGRAEAGQAAKLIVDAQMAYRTAEEGLRLLPVLQQVGIWFLEAPLPLDDVAGHARMAGRGVPLGVGDLGLTHVDEFIEAMDRGKADICQPDITHGRRLHPHQAHRRRGGRTRQAGDHPRLQDQHRDRRQPALPGQPPRRRGAGVLDQLLAAALADHQGAHPHRRRRHGGGAVRPGLGRDPRLGVRRRPPVQLTPHRTRRDDGCPVALPVAREPNRITLLQVRVTSEHGGELAQRGGGQVDFLHDSPTSASESPPRAWRLSPARP